MAGGRGEHVYGYEPEKGKGLWALRGHIWLMCQMKSGQPHVKPRLMRPKHYFFLETVIEWCMKTWRPSFMQRGNHEEMGSVDDVLN